MAKITEEEAGRLHPEDMRSLIRNGQWTGPSEMACTGYWKANLVVLPQDWAYEFMLFAQRNPLPCYITASTDPGETCPQQIAHGADLRTDLPKYRVFKDGKLIDEPTDIIKYWRNDLVAFFIGVFPNIALILQQAGVRYRHIGSYTSNIHCVPAGRLKGKMAITCTIFKNSHDAVKAIQISSRYPDAHGAPVHIGYGTSIGIKDFSHPDIVALAHHDNIQHPEMVGRGYELELEEVALWWGCGVTPQLAAIEAKVPFMITHKPAHLFISDKRSDELSII
jgi:uncharacterized protein YcsI (UPF0317 family)